MRLQRTNKGFTLIELLVVITIIGILATGAVSVYTSQIQKARDSTRLTDISAVKSGIEQFYQDTGEYPTKVKADWQSGGVQAYVPKIPSDPKTGQTSANSSFDYSYSVSTDANTVLNQEFEISTHFEQQGNITSKAATDGWNHDYRLEQGINLTDTDHDTQYNGAIAGASSTGDCFNASAGTTACTNAGAVMLIRGTAQ